MKCSSRQFRWLPFFLPFLLLSLVSVTPLHAQTVSLGATNLNFGNQATGTTSSEKTVRLTNTGTTPLLISGITKPSAPFSESDNCPISPASLAHRAFCTISATFGPTTSGSSSGSISVADNATGSPQVITLQGTGTQQATLSPTSLSFASQGLGTTSSVKAITLTNNLNTPLIFTAVASGDFKMATAPNNPCGVSVPASGHCSIGLIFSPTQLGARTGTLTVTDNASNSPQTANLTGTGSTASLISLSVSPLNPSIPVGGTQGFLATGTFPGNIGLGVTTLVRWSSSAKKIASISNTSPNQGVTTGNAKGNATITARLSGVSSSTTLSVGAGKTNQTITFTGTPGTAAYGSNFAVSATASSGLLVTVSASGACTISGSTVTVASGTGTCTLTASQVGNATYNAAPNVINNVAATPATAVFSGLSPSQSITFGFASVTLSGTISAGSLSPSAETVSIAINGTSVTPTIGSAGGFSAIFATAAIPTSTTPYVITYTYVGDGNFSSASDSSRTLTVTAASGVFVPTGSMSAQRYLATTTLLNNGMVLITGGSNSSDGPILASAEVYDPATGTFTSTGSMNTGRASHTATLLNNGMVLIAGGFSTDALLSSAELYNPTTGTFTITGSLNAPRQEHTATVLNSGMVLIAGGDGAQNVLASAELYDPATGTFTTTGSMTIALVSQTATLLNNGMVLIAGGQGDQGFLLSAELYNPATGTFTSTGSLNTARGLHTATLLNNGMVLVAGGADESGFFSSAELFDPATGTFAPTGSLNTARASHTATLLNNGMVLIASGIGISDFLSSAELYDPVTGTFIITGSLNVARAYDTVTLLNNGMVLLAGGETGNNGVFSFLSSAELYEPATLIPQNLVSIAVSPVSPTVPLGATQRFIATGTFSDSSTEQLASVTWKSSNGAIATIGDDGTNLGAGDALAIGSTTISACTGTLCGSTTLTVAAPALVSIAVTPANPSIAFSAVQQFTATGNYTDGTTQNLTSAATWSSSVTGVVTINAAGLATGLLGGSTTITATSGSISGTATLTVFAPPTLVSISVTPAYASIAVNAEQQFSATGTYSDGTTQNLTSSTAWSSSATNVAAINFSGVAVGVGGGLTTITATSGSISGTTTLSVFSILESVAVTPANPSIAVGAVQQFTATGSYNDGTTKNLTGVATWSSSVTSVATINFGGLARGASGGSTTISACAGLCSSTTLTVGPVGVFVPTGSMNAVRYDHTATLLNNGMVLMAGGDDFTIGALSSTELYSPVTGEFTNTGSLSWARGSHTATLLNSGMVLIVGGFGFSSESLSSAELYNPVTGRFTPTGSLNIARGYHTATLLTNGMVLIVGGFDAGNTLLSAELYDPSTGTFSPTGRLITARYGHTATLLNNGRVLITGGTDGSEVLSSAELYDPTVGGFTGAGGMSWPRQYHTNTLLNDGTVLITGGTDGNEILSSAELYDPTWGTFTTIGFMGSPRETHTAALLNDGTVLIAGGGDGTTIGLNSAELYNPTTFSFTPASGMNTARESQTATLLQNGTVLIGGGENLFGPLSSAEVYTPFTHIPYNLVSIAVSPVNPTIPLGATQRFIATGTFSDNSTELLASVTWESSNTAIATITDDATNLGAADALAVGSTTISACTGTLCGSTTLTVTAPALVSIAVNPPSGTISPGLTIQFGATGTYTDGTTQDLTTSVVWSSTAPGVATINLAGLATGLVSGNTTITATSGAISGTATLFVLPALVSVSVTPANPLIALSAVQQFIATGTYSDGTAQDLTGTATWSSSATSVATINSTGIAVGVGGGSTTITATSSSIGGSTTLTVVSSLAFAPTGSMNVARESPTATLLNDGTVLVAGGLNTAYMSSAELYDPAAGIFTFAGSMNTARFIHTATLLNNGQVLIAGGNGDGSVVLDSAELYDPSMGTFTPTGSLNIARQYHTATLLNNGMVLIAGGEGGPDNTTPFPDAELYDPSTGTFTFTGSMGTARQDHTATLLNSGLVLIVGGGNETGFLNSAELYDPTTSTFAQTGSLNIARQYHTATLLNNGLVLIAGGYNTGIAQYALSSAELFDPSTGTFTPTGSLNTGRNQHTATLLNNGMVLIAGGQDSTTTISSAELYDPATGTFTVVGSLNKDREDHTATLLSNGTGQVLIAGGFQNFVGPLASAELFVPAELTPPNLVSITVEPLTPTLSSGATQQFIATGIFSDSSTQQLASVTWSSSDTTIAQISNDASNRGMAIAIASGTVTVTATAGGVSGSVTLTVGP